MKLLFAFLAVAVVSALPPDWPANVKTYDGYMVIEIIPKTRGQVEFLANLRSNEKYDFWREPGSLNSPVHIMLHCDDLNELSTTLKPHQLTYTTYVDDVSKDIKEFLDHEVQRRQGKSKVFDLNDFNTLEDIEDWLQNDLLPACDAVADLTCELVASDRVTQEGRNIWIFRMTTAGTPKETLLIDGLIHCREYIVGGTVFKMMDKMVNEFDSDADVRTIFDSFDVTFMPVLNPDGYVFTWTDDRLWRKNRFPNEGSVCLGVDLNRNFGRMWGIEGTSPNPCSDLYPGTGPLSEQEALAVDDEMARIGDNFRAYITYHSYGYMWMHPWGNTVDNDGRTCERAEDHDEMYRVAEATAEAIMASDGSDGRQWAYGTSCEVIYETTGASDDHAKEFFGCPYPYNPELRGVGFVISPDQIEPSFVENWDGLKAMVDAIVNGRNKN